jgi:putative CRISPR-associated protein (TIGR02619 family)
MFILSPCGTSLLTNLADKRQSELARRYANIKEIADISSEDAECLRMLVQAAKERISDATVQEAARYSAELNGIIKLFNGTTPTGNNHHLLLCTDTWLGEQTASLVSDWLSLHGQTVEIKRQIDLQTGDIDSFQCALSDLVCWCDDTIPGYRAAQYRIVFNLTGGFKSVQGFLMILATFYADETVYVFESSNQLLRIPRLPVRMDAGEAVRSNLITFRRLALQLSVATGAMPEIFLMKLGDQHALSQWGELVWAQTRPRLYAEKLLPSPDSRIIFSQSFEKSVENLQSDRLKIVNERIDQLTRHFIGSGNYNLRSLDLKPLKGGPCSGSTHEFDAWADQDAKRIFCHYEGDKLILDRLDKALH